MTKGAHLMVRKDGVFCTVCFAVEPVHPGKGTPLSTFLLALEGVMHRHPNKKHNNPFEKEKSSER